MMNELGNLLPSGFPYGLRVLLVQDDETCIQVMEEMLKSWNYQGIYTITISCIFKIIACFISFIISFVSSISQLILCIFR